MTEGMKSTEFWLSIASMIAGTANKLIDQKSSQNLCNELGQDFIQGHRHWRMSLQRRSEKTGKSERHSSHSWTPPRVRSYPHSDFPALPIFRPYLMLT